MLALGALSLAFIEGPGWGFRSVPVMACLALALAAGIAFVAIERRVPDPLVPLGVFRNRAFSAAIAAAGLMTFGMYGMLFVLPLYLQAVQLGRQFTPEAFTQSDTLYRQVLQIDPRYAPAWRELARKH